MFLPINGRIAIIDNEIKEVEPLFKVFSKNRIPYVFIKGDEQEYLPDESDETNDIRIIFLDLNLLGNRTPTDKEVKSTLYSVLKRVISKNNFPYSIILWSKQEQQYKKLVEELFNDTLSDRKPISIEEFIKSDFFNLDEEVLETDKDIIEEVKKILLLHQAYSTLIYWENKVHKSADITLQNIFSSYDDLTWVDKTNFVVSKLGEGYLGNKNYSKSNYIEKTKGSLQAFNNVFSDTLEYNIYNCPNLYDQPVLEYDEAMFNKSELLATINSKLLYSKSDTHIDYTGTVSEDENPKSDKIFETILNNTFDRYSVQNEIKEIKEALTDREKQVSALASKKRKEIRKNWQKIYVVLTPLCDKVQNKNVNSRVVKGFIMNAEYVKYIDKRSEALFISPPFFDEDLKLIRVLVFNFRYFFTFQDPSLVKDINPLFRLRFSMVAELQSKLSRHINRQGILFVE